MTSKRRTCANGDGEPVHPPSLVLYRACFERLDAKFAALAERAEATRGQKECPVLGVETGQDASHDTGNGDT